MTRRPLISGNWKMNLNHFEAIQTVIETEDFDFHLGAQHCHWEVTGALTGEVSPAFLEKLNVVYVIAGHSERREIFGETDEMVKQKVAAIQAHNMTPILCCGETLEEREAGDTESKVLGQIAAALAGRTNEQIASLVIAYEPIWAIGTGKTATADDAQAVCATIRRSIGELADGATAESVRIQYGGSVKAANATELMSQPDIDGALVGGASLNPEEFAKIVQFDA